MATSETVPEIRCTTFYFRKNDNGFFTTGLAREVSASTAVPVPVPVFNLLANALVLVEDSEF
jgi:hypothetical protein